MLLVGFDSAWTRTKIGAIVGAVSHDDGRITELGRPRPAQFEGGACDDFSRAGATGEEDEIERQLEKLRNLVAMTGERCHRFRVEILGHQIEQER